MPFAEEVKKVEQSGNFPLYLKILGYALLTITAIACGFGWAAAGIVAGGVALLAAQLIERARG